MSEQIDSRVCPFCKKNNECKANSEVPCWCHDIKVPPQLHAFVPKKMKMKACICRSCIELYKKDKEAFMKLYGV